MNPRPPITRPTRHCDGEWLELRADLGALTDARLRETERRLPDLLAWNITLDAGLKFVLRPRSRLVLCAEVRATEDREEAALAQLETDLINAARGTSPDTVPAPRSPCGDPVRDTLETVCGDAGWNVTRGSGGMLHVQLDGSGALGPACVTAIGGSNPRIQAALTPYVEMAPASLLALAVLGLWCGGVLRLVRAGIDRRERQQALWIEVCLGSQPAPGDILDALTALSAAGRLAGEEARALLDPRIARAYLDLLRETLPRHFESDPSAMSATINQPTTEERKAA